MGDQRDPLTNVKVRSTTIGLSSLSRLMFGRVKPCIAFMSPVEVDRPVVLYTLLQAEGSAGSFANQRG